MALRHALRSLRQAPAYAVAVVLTLALGLAALGTMFALVHGVLLAPLPYGQPGRLVALDLVLADGSRIGDAPALHALYRRHARQVEDVALYREGRANVGGGSGMDAAENLAVAWASASLMPLLQVAPQLGRTFTAAEDLRGGPQAVILSDAEWRARFGASPDAIGRILVVNDVPREVIGVMPPDFAFPHAGIRLWLPAKPGDDTTARDFIFAGVARLAPGATQEGAQRELAALLPRLAESYPRLGSGGSTAAWIAESKPVPRLQPLREAITGALAPTLWLLAALAGLVLLVAWANVANLLLIRVDAARRDRAVRAALGAGTLRAASPLLGEWGLLGAAATLLALLAVAAALWALRGFGPADLPRLTELSLGPWTVAFTLGTALLGGIGGLLLLARPFQTRDLSDRLRDGGHGTSAGVARQRLRAAVVVLQVAAALVVLAGSALLLRTAQRLQQVDPGFEARPVSTFQVLLPFARYDDVGRVAFHARLLERVRALPSVQAAGLVARLPLGAGRDIEQDVRADGDAQARRVAVNVASDGYFAAMRIPLLAGRDFRALDAQRPHEVLVSRQAARRLFGDATGRASTGRRLTLEPGGPTWTVVGVVGDVHQEDLARAPGPMVYRPQVVAAQPATEPGPLPGLVLVGVVGDVHQEDLARAPGPMVYRPQVVAAQPATEPGPLPGLVLVVRADGPLTPLAAAVRDVVRALDPGVPVFEATAMDEVVRRSLARLDLTLAVAAAAALVSVALGMLGLYGVMAFRVAQRRREFGLRLALGAPARRIAGSVVGGGLALVAIGCLVGLPLLAAGAAALRAAVPAVQPWDLPALAGAILLLTATAALAAWLPARRAAAVDPAQALRAE